MVWYCKANFKTNPPRLKTKKEEPYAHSFKYIKKLQELQEIRANSIYLAVSSIKQ